MERLTERYKGEAVVFCNQMCSDWNECNPILCQSKRILEKLAHYEDLEEQGLLLKLPCKVGDKIYYVEDGEIYKYKANSIDVKKENGKYIFCIECMDFETEEFGKIVFLTKEEAEAKLEELKDDGFKKGI